MTTITLTCRGCGGRKEGMNREPYDPPHAVRADLLCPECCDGGEKDPETFYYDAEDHEIEYKPEYLGDWEKFKETIEG